MLLNELLEAIQESCDRYEKMETRCLAYSEYSLNEYLTNLKEAELKVLTEGGSESDLLYLEAEAKEGFLVRTKNTLNKLNEEIKKSVGNIASDVKTFVNDKKTQDTIKEVEDLIQENPKLKDAKFEIFDDSQIEKVYKDSISEVNRELANYKAGRFTDGDQERLKSIEDKYDKAMSIAVKAVVVASVAGVILAIKNSAKKAEMLDKEASSFDADSFGFNEDTKPTDIAAAMDAVRLRNRIIKEYGNYVIRVGNKGNNALQSFKKLQKAVDKRMNESVNDYLDTILSNAIEEATFETENYITPERYLSMMEAELF